MAQDSMALPYQWAIADDVDVNSIDANDVAIATITRPELAGKIRLH